VVIPDAVHPLNGDPLLEVVGMRAAPGDRLVIRGHHVGERLRDGEILEVLGEEGGPLYVVRWSDDGHVSRVFPGSDAYIEHFVRRRTRRGAPGRKA
jgi:hypothetical protein